MDLSQAFMHSKLTSNFLPASCLDKKSELLLPIKKNVPLWHSSALVNHRGGNKSTTLNRFCCPETQSDGLALMRGIHEACTSKRTLFSFNKRSVLREAAVAGKTMESKSDIAACTGLGIVDFLKDKNLLITGATGFLAKVLIEKILRMQPDVGKLYLIIRADESTSAFRRLNHEVLSTELFNGLREIHGDEFEEFMLKRLVPVAGDMTKQNLGIEKDMVDVLTKEVNIIVSSAATTTFDERYDVALETNTKAVTRLLEFGKCCEKSQLFMHISTAYVNGQLQGRSLEEPFQMGYSIAGEKSASVPPLDIQAEFHLAKKALADFDNEFSNVENYKLKKAKVTQRMKDLGMERARTYGWQDTYSFSKAMGEMIIVNGSEDLPVVILRPTIIESTCSQPFSGWIEGHRMIDPVITYHAKGQIDYLLGDPDTVLDVIPADMVVNATLAAMAKHAGKAGVKVYHVASSVANPLRLGEIVTIIFEHFKCNPYIDHNGKPIRLLKEMTLINTMENYRLVLDTTFDSPSSINGSSSEHIVQQLKHMAKIHEPYLFWKAGFDISNSEKLSQELSPEERESFGFDIRNVKWRDYIGNIHIPGLRQHVWKGRGTGKQIINI
eukprot:PITA_21293